MAAHENLGHGFDCHKQKFMQKYRKLMLMLMFISSMNNMAPL